MIFPVIDVGVFHVKLNPHQISELVDSFKIDEDVVARLERYCTLVLDANLRINLISRGGDQAEEVRRQLFLSLAALPLICHDADLTWLDVGSGGGFPAIPISLCRPRGCFTLAESIAKKAFFLERTAETLDLHNLNVTNTRVGSFGDDSGIKLGHFDWVSVKAVSDWEDTLQWGESHLSLGGKLLTYKPESPTSAESSIICAHGFELIDDVVIKDDHRRPPVHIIKLSFSTARK